MSDRPEHFKFAIGAYVEVTSSTVIGAGSRGHVIEQGMDNELTYHVYRIKFDRPGVLDEGVYSEFELREIDLVTRVGSLSSESQSQ